MAKQDDQQAASSNATTELGITIRHCNSISEGNIPIRRGSLNIKYGPNGIGKSTIAHALKLRTVDYATKCSTPGAQTPGDHRGLARRSR